MRRDTVGNSVLSLVTLEVEMKQRWWSEQEVHYKVGFDNANMYLVIG